MNGIETTRETLDLVHQYLEAAIGDCDNETLTKMLPGATVGPISHIYLHALSNEDWAIQTLLQNKPKLIDSAGWYEKLGVPVAAPNTEADWAKAKIDLPLYQEYGKAVYAATDAWLASATDADLSKEIPWHSGQTHNAAWILADVVHSHLGFHAGEIAALKGVLGLKGLPW
jgi:hypothetical protein